MPAIEVHVTTDATEERPALRADAQRNRSRIIATARQAVAREGIGASLRAIARDAGVGLGTLYRHFPTRDDLLQEVLQDSFDTLTLRAQALAHEQTPLDALESWMDELIASTATHQGLAAAMLDKTQDPASSLHRSCHALRQEGDVLLASAQADQMVRPDIAGADLMALVSALAWLCNQKMLEAEERRRMLDLVMGGLRR